MSPIGKKNLEKNTEHKIIRLLAKNLNKLSCNIAFIFPGK